MIQEHMGIWVDSLIAKLEEEWTVQEHEESE